MASPSSAEVTRVQSGPEERGGTSFATAALAEGPLAGWLRTVLLKGPGPIVTAAAWIAIVAVLVWAYWQPLFGLAVRWWKEADYGHGFFVPIFSAVLLALRWKDFRDKPFNVTTGAFCLGVAFLVVSWLCRYVSYAYYVRLLEPASLIPALVGIALLAGGWRALAWSWPAIVFLVFMIPLPGAIADGLRHPLQRIGTIASTYLLQVMGVPAIARGNIIVLTDGELGVVEACSGLRMMVLFFAVCVGAAFIVRRPLLDRVIMVISAPVIAVAANVFRITLTGVLHELTTPQLADFVFHDLAGWLMAPVALALLSAEMWWLDKVLIPVAEPAPLPLMESRRQKENDTPEQPARETGRPAPSSVARSSPKRRSRSRR